MSVIVWLSIGIAIWHFTVFVPDRFWAGIIGAFLGSTIGAMITGGIFQIASGRSIGTTDIITLLVAIPGSLIGMAIVYAYGVSREQPDILDEVEKAQGLR